jgi:leucyl aminopeptidase (aminopeptidase T)
MDMLLKSNRLHLWIAIALLNAPLALSSRAQTQDYSAIAERIIKTCANVKPGDVVVISGGKHNFAVLEDLALQAAKAGGLANIFVDSDRLERAVWSEVPEKYLEQQPTYFVEWLKQMDVYIALPTVEDPKSVFGNLPPERLAKANKAGQCIMDALNGSKLRAVFVGYPTQSDAEVSGLPFSSYKQAFLDALGADYQSISTTGTRLKRLLEGSQTVRVTSPAGTDFTFSIGNRTVSIDDGIMTAEKAQAATVGTRTVTLPGGSVSVAPIETSANGKIVIPRTQCQYKPLVGMGFEFKNGRSQNYHAEQGQDCFDKTMEPYAGPKDMFGVVTIGLNPAAKVLEEPGDYRPGYAAGLVTIGIGDNQLLGGKNRVEGSGGFTFPIVKATVTVDGKVIVRDGRLEF